RPTTSSRAAVPAGSARSAAWPSCATTPGSTTSCRCCSPATSCGPTRTSPATRLSCCPGTPTSPRPRSSTGSWNGPSASRSPTRRTTARAPPPPTGPAERPGQHTTTGPSDPSNGSPHATRSYRRPRRPRQDRQDHQDSQDRQDRRHRPRGARVTSVPFDDRDGVIWLDGAFVPWRDARLHVLSHGLHYGGGVFEGIRVYDGRPFKSAEHFRRFHASARELNFAVPHSVTGLDAALEETVRRQGIADGYVRPVAWRGS